MLRSLARKGLRAQPSIWEQQAGCTAQQRSFSQTPAQQKNLVIFDKTSTDSLNPILEEIQSKIILPFHLNLRQRERVFSVKMKNSLRSDPVYLEVDGYEHKFGHISKTSLPSSRDITWKALRAMETPEDWNNFNRLLSGMQTAGRRFSDVDYAKMIRIAGSKGQIYTIIEAARQVRHTAFKLNTLEKVNSVLHFVQMRAANSGWDQAMTEQSLRWTEMVLEMLEDKAHTTKYDRVQPPFSPLSRDPQVLGAPLHLAAVLAVKHNGGKDVDGKVSHYAKQIIKRWPADKGLKQLYDHELYDNWETGVAYLIKSRTQYLSVASPILHGMLLAPRVLPDDEAAQLQAIANRLGVEVKKMVENDRYPAERGMATYNVLFEGKKEEAPVEAQNEKPSEE